MSVVDLSYAKEAAVAPGGLRLLAISIKGWTIGWAFFENDLPKLCGSFVVKSHAENEKTEKMDIVPPYYRNIGALQVIARLCQQHGVTTIVSHNPDQKAPLWALPSSIAAAMALDYQDYPQWRDHVGAGIRELTSWATVLMGRSPANDEEVFSLGLGAAFIKSQVKLEEGPLATAVSEA